MWQVSITQEKWSKTISYSALPNRQYTHKQLLMGQHITQEDSRTIWTILFISLIQDGTSVQSLLSSSRDKKGLIILFKFGTSSKTSHRNRGEMQTC